MRSKLRRVRQSFIGLRGVAIFGVLFLAAFIILLSHLSRYPEEVAESVAIEDARIYSRALSSFRTIYTKLVVQPARERGIEITHDISKTHNALLLPATMTRLIGEEMGKSGNGGEANLYSPYPFPWRQKDGGLRDDFAKKAWESLVRDPSTPYVSFEDLNGVRTLRYATADVMRQACVQCHNSHPQSPRLGWKVGDVRGVLEVRRPVGNVVIQASTRAQSIFWMVLAVGSLATAGLAAMMILIRNIKAEILARTEAESTIEDQQAMLVSSSKLSAIGEMAGQIAHEINTPLGAIVLTAQGLQNKAKKEPLTEVDVIAKMDFILQITSKLSRIINSMRKLAGHGANEGIRDVNVKSLIEDALLLSEGRFKKIGAELTVQNHLGEKANIQCRASEISQVLVNLLNNAHDAVQTQNTKWARLEVSEKAGRAIFKVSDSGSGIDQGNIHKLFLPNFSTKSLDRGTGFGLSVSKKLIEQHGGKIFLDTGEKNTTFVFEIPLEQTEALARMAA